MSRAANLVHFIWVFLEENVSVVTALHHKLSFEHLAHYAATSLLLSYGMESQGRLWGKSKEGLTQSSPEAGPLFTVSIQIYLEHLYDTLVAGGGMARTGWDDIYVVGLGELVFPTLYLF